MGEENIILLESDVSKDNWWISCHAMWQDIFGDSDAYMDYYGRYKWPVNQVFLLIRNGWLCSMLHMNPYHIRIGEREEELHYIVGVSTREELRGQGYMRRLLRAMFHYLYRKGEGWTYLMPAAEAIYEPFGFRPVFWAEPVEVFWCGGGCTLEDGTAGVYSYEACPEERKRALEHFAGKCLSEKFTVYPVHDGRYFQEISDELMACGGELLILEDHGEVIGYTEYMYDAGEEVCIEIAETVLAAGREEQGYGMIEKYLLSHFGRDGLRVLFTETAFLQERLMGARGNQVGENRIVGEQRGERQMRMSHARRRKKKCQIMARVLNFARAAGDLKRPEGWPERVCCRIMDSFLEKNNGVWELCFHGGKTTVTRSQQKPSVCLDMGEFTELFFRQDSFYINDMV